ncbi:CBS domain-containing protein [Streptomyces griseocarneus]|uniref:CBS domain-containing protein n=1 Tax=Streptomyces griseocarneus TaxID=51201 RepID=UPI00167D3515|nr:CBS domain-containing protein [Streptomyces griseocarneus]MBZ6475750.1 CBS domain-containing protein [Streptomyces griseocarneus]GHG50979.1 oxidoreductase [Streptomyces griseocarneus]
MTRLVKDVMTAGVATVWTEASLAEVAQMMRDQDVGDVVVASGDTVVGMITDRDITVRAVADGMDPLSLSAGSVCTPDPVVIGPLEPAERAAELMRLHAVRLLPVVEDGRPVGLVSLGDLTRERDARAAPAGAGRTVPGR